MTHLGRLGSVLVLVVAAAVASATTFGASSEIPDRFRGAWSGSYSLVGQEQIGLVIGKASVVVALAESHATAQPARVSLDGRSLAVLIPGRPADIRLVLRREGARLSGLARQGGTQGPVALKRGGVTELLAPGFYRAGSRSVAVVDDPYGPARLVDLSTGEVHGLYQSATGLAIGHGWATRAPVVGSVRLGIGGGRIGRVSATRLPLRQYEVRFRSGAVTLAGTLTLPRGAPSYPALAFVTGSGPTVRAYLPDLQALLVDSGVAVLSYDKRGVGQSSGFYPGASPTQAALDILARDAAAAARFLARQPGIDANRVGLAGQSQAGWIMPLAARLEPGVRFLVSFSGPAVTTDENDLYQDLTGEGETLSGRSPQEIDAEVLRRGKSGFDPLPSIRALSIPMLWIYGGLDQHIPPRLSAERLRPLAADPSLDLTVAVYPKANHALVETRTGLTAEMLRSDRFAPGLFPDVRRWLAAHGLAAR